MTDTNPPTSYSLFDTKEMHEIIRLVLATRSVDLGAGDQERLRLTLAGSGWETTVANAGKRFEWESQRFIPSLSFKADDLPVWQVDSALLRLVAAYLDIKDDATSLVVHAGHTGDPGFPFADLAWLRGFTNLRRLHVSGSNMTDRMVASILDLEIEELFIENYASNVTLWSSPSLTKLYASAVKFEKKGEWPNLKVADLKRVGPIAPLLAGSPQMEDLKHDIEPRNWIEGLHQKNKAVQVVTSPSLKRAVLDSNFTVKDCPELIELEIGGEVEIINTPKLENLYLNGAQVPSGIAHLDSLKEIGFEHFSADVIDLPANAKLVPRGEGAVNAISIGVGERIENLPMEGLTHLRVSQFGASPDVLAPLSEANDLESIELLGNITDLSALSDLPNLRVVDVRNARKLTDLSPLASLPNIELIAISRTGMPFVPEELADKVRELKGLGLIEDLVAN